MKVIFGVSALLLSLISVEAIGQDTLRVRSEFSLVGRRQTGNLDQIGVNPSAKLGVGNSAFELETGANYQFLRVNGFTSINDLWINGIYRVHPRKRVFPFAMAYYGFADSYRIDQSLIGGIGAGVNLQDGSKKGLLQGHLFLGYADVDFLTVSAATSSHTSFAVGSFIRSDFAIVHSGLGIHWEFHSYHAVSDRDFYGANNLIILRYALVKGFHLTATHSTIYNHTTSEGISRTNTLLMVGLAFLSNKNL